MFGLLERNPTELKYGRFGAWFQQEGDIYALYLLLRSVFGLYGAWMDSNRCVPILSSLCGAGCDGRGRKLAEAHPRVLSSGSGTPDHHAAGGDASSKSICQRRLVDGRMVLRTTHVPISGVSGPYQERIG